MVSMVSMYLFSELEKSALQAIYSVGIKTLQRSVDSFFPV